MTSADANLDQDAVSKEEGITHGSINTVPKESSGAEVELDSPVPEKSQHEQWNNPKINIYRVLCANFSFVIMGMNDAAYGVFTLLFLR